MKNEIKLCIIWDPKINCISKLPLNSPSSDSLSIVRGLFKIYPTMWIFLHMLETLPACDFCIYWTLFQHVISAYVGHFSSMWFLHILEILPACDFCICWSFFQHVISAYVAHSSSKWSAVISLIPATLISFSYF